MSKNVDRDVEPSLLENDETQLNYVFFDWNGTLQMGTKVSKEEKLRQRCEALYKAFSQYLGHIPFEELVVVVAKTKTDPQFSNLNNSDALRRVWEALPDMKPISEELHHEMVQSYCSGDHGNELYPTVLATVEELNRRGVKMGLIRNSKMPEKSMRKKLLKHGLDAYFDTVVMSGEEGVEKPAPGIFRAAVKKAGIEHLEPSTILFVGNQATVDVAGARSMGWRSVLVCNTEQSSSGVAHHDLPTIEHLLHLLPGEQKTIIPQNKIDPMTDPLVPEPKTPASSQEHA